MRPQTQSSSQPALLLGLGPPCLSNEQSADSSFVLSCPPLQCSRGGGSFSFRAEPMRTCSHSSQKETTIDLIEGAVQIKQIEHSGTGIFLLWRQVAEAE